jgi:hypothetical protein
MFFCSKETKESICNAYKFKNSGKTYSIKRSYDDTILKSLLYEDLSKLVVSYLEEDIIFEASFYTSLSDYLTYLEISKITMNDKRFLPNLMINYESIKSSLVSHLFNGKEYDHILSCTIGTSYNDVPCTCVGAIYDRKSDSFIMSPINKISCDYTMKDLKDFLTIFTDIIEDCVKNEKYIKNFTLLK